MLQETEGDDLDQDRGPAQRELDRGEGARARPHLPVQGRRGRR